MTVAGTKGNNQVLRTEELMKRRERMELKYNAMQDGLYRQRETIKYKHI